jgi:signal transduction histidine kinase
LARPKVSWRDPLMRVRTGVDAVAVRLQKRAGRRAVEEGTTLQFLSDEHAALRRVATLVARGVAPQIVFDSVCEETGRLIGATTVNLAHFTSDGINLTISGWSVRGVHVPTGTQLPLDGHTINALVQRTGAPGRVDNYEDAPGPLAARLRELGVKSEVGAPVVVDGRVWGALIAGTDQPGPLPAGTELRVASFAELIATAVSNATTRAELIASRARIVTAGDDARRRIARDLHDGAQQRLVSTLMSLQLADQRFDHDPSEARGLLRDAMGHARDGLVELRELAAGVHPSILTNRGLRAALDALAQRTVLLVDLQAPDERYPPQVEAAAYFVIAEALTNVAKHAKASCVYVCVDEHDGSLAIDVRDDGSGGADPRGSGLRGLKDRAEALGGGFQLDSLPGHGTHLRATLPLSPPH